MNELKNRRNQYNYREEYLKHNKGFFFGKVYFCSICHKPISKSELEVDHIIPLGKQGVNHICNCVATCQKCNRSKGDTLDDRAMRQLFWKLCEELCILFSYILRNIFQTIHKIILYTIPSKEGIKQTPNFRTIILIIVGIISIFLIYNMGV